MFSVESLKKNFPLKNSTTFKIGGKAKYFLEAQSQEEIIEAIKWAQQKKLPFFVLGGGSNVLIGDKKYKGVVIQAKNQDIKIENENNDFKIIEANAGVFLAKLVGVALKNNLTGMEWAIGIPGTLGGAIYGNAGSFENSMQNSIEEVKVFLIDSQETKIFKKEECNFGYRDSIFKNNKNLIILSAKIKLFLASHTEIENKMNEFFLQKKKSQPLECYSAGSVFKNPVGFLAWDLIEKAGFRGKQIGKAQVSNKHSNFIVNVGLAKAKDVKKLIKKIKKQVKKKFGVILEEEIKYLNKK